MRRPAANGASGSGAKRAGPGEDISEAVAATDQRPESGAAETEENKLLQAVASESTNVWNDEAAESAFRAEARERGEALAPPPTAEKDVDDGKGLPPLEELVQRLSPDVRDVLDDLFRAKFTSVRRVPAKAFKG